MSAENDNPENPFEGLTTEQLGRIGEMEINEGPEAVAALLAASKDEKED